ncbi:MAG: VanZ family protein [Chlamydiae bacterium]|nr:VanZ family protein [Chlamydiota bacterium]MBI3266727.1 VanZ family protein [Chlamydiota bacterium]
MKKWIRRFSVLAYCSLIFYLSSRPFPKGLPSFQGMDKGMHFFEYGFLAFLMYRMVSVEKFSLFRTCPVMMSWILTVLYGISDEIHQHFIPTRSMEFLDWVMDTMGALFVLQILKWRKREET